MATLRNIGRSALSVPALDNRTVEPDEAVEVSNEVAVGFIDQDAVWQVEIDDDDPRTADELRSELEARGLPTKGRKSQLVERLAAADRQVASEPASAAEQMAAQSDEQGE